MRREGIVLGGEQSGHLIHSGLGTTGDGLVAGRSLAGIADVDVDDTVAVVAGTGPGTDLRIDGFVDEPLGTRRLVDTHLPRRADDRSARSERAEHGIIIDYAEDGRPIGLEITAPEAAAVEQINAVLRAIGQPTVRAADLAPLAAA
mgnify:CR=1 FL=1